MVGMTHNKGKCTDRNGIGRGSKEIDSNAEILFYKRITQELPPKLKIH